MFRTLATVACLAVAAGAPGGEKCAVASTVDGCAPTPVRDHSLLQVHPVAKSFAAKEHNSTGEKASVIKLQQEKAVQGDSTEKQSLDGKVDGGLESESGMDPYPEDYDLDTDYPRDDKGTRADTVRELQSATLPGDGDIGKNTKPGLSDSWNVDKMFVSDSDGGGHVSLRDMIPWGYRSPDKMASALLSNVIKKAEKEAVEKDGDEQKDDHRDEPEAEAKDGVLGLNKDSSEGTEDDDEADGDADAAAKDGPDAAAALSEGKDKAEKQAAKKDGAKQKDDQKDEAKAAAKEEGSDLKSDSSEGTEDEDEADAAAALSEGKDKAEKQAAEKDGDKHNDDS